MNPVRWLAAVGFVLVLLLQAGGVHAHEMTTAEMTMREMPNGQLLWSWGVPAQGQPIENELAVHWPAGCSVEDGRVLTCSAGLQGEVEVEGLGRSYSAAVLMIRWKSGEERAYTLTSRRPTVRLYGGTEDTRAAWDVAATYALLGVEHILSGFDHLLFVISLLFLVGFQRRLVATITAFTLAHSITLAASALGALSLRPPPVEATIALSIVLVAMEALRRDDTLTRRWPALVAFLFGLVHGLGFAGALAEIGLPARHATIALLTFNVGVEAGQLLVVAVCGVLLLAVRRLPRLEIGRQVALYAIGSVAAYWTIGRLAALA
ncbi:MULTISPECIES: HupE/UreJ family protein [Ramlibacter]|uniref:HupE/UreJ family protein n=1 Tax=Ramlibacter pinisoli TaxID=2682844 RepID=A0A6N8IXH5_9BURK|nr:MULTISPECIES: HupE/UreJ family protein [Ramlibacter]MBA2961731.1 HupE/UreJ family protein [Ramlibacter sp. CGMCC 1.13660]MVQ31674.1 HupE/UreJ family protein [Ramlibacter pinisoli]